MPDPPVSSFHGCRKLAVTPAQIPGFAGWIQVKTRREGRIGTALLPAVEEVAPRLRLQLLGGFRAWMPGGAELRLTRRKAMALLAYLALPPIMPCTRDKLIGLLWEEMGESAARANLRQTLAALRVALGGLEPAPLQFNGDNVGIDPAIIDCDVIEFERVTAAESPADLRRAIELYRGPFLDGLQLSNPEGEQWLLRERERLSQRLLLALERAASHALRRNALLEAQDLASALLAQDPLRESAHRLLMQAYAGQGQLNAALRQYRACEAALARDLQVPPEPETRRLLAELQARRAEDADGHSGTAAATAASHPPLRPSVAVLPFANASGDPEQDYYANGLTEDIITDLAQVSGLFVAARHRVFAYRGRAMQLTDVARELQVGHVVEGSLRRSGDRVRITVQLVDGATGEHTWVQRYERDLGEFIGLHDAIAQAIAAVLRVRLLPRERDSINAPLTRSAAAYDCYLLGRSFYVRGIDHHSLRLARSLLDRAVELDPRFARALAISAICDSYLATTDAGASFAGIERKVNRALRLDPLSAESHAARGMNLYAAGRLEEAARAFEAAMRLGPNLFEAHFFHARNCRLQGQHAKAATLFARAAEMRPEDYRACGLLADACRMLGRHDESVLAGRRCIDRLARELEAHPENADAWAFGSAVLASLQQHGRGAEWASRALLIDPEDPLVHYNVARTAALTGELRVALGHLERAFRALPEYRQRLARWMRSDDDLRALRTHGRFRALLRQHGGAPD